MDQVYFLLQEKRNQPAGIMKWHVLWHENSTFNQKFNIVVKKLLKKGVTKVAVGRLRKYVKYTFFYKKKKGAINRPALWSDFFFCTKIVVRSTIIFYQK